MRMRSLHYSGPAEIGGGGELYPKVHYALNRTLKNGSDILASYLSCGGGVLKSRARVIVDIHPVVWWGAPGPRPS
jgi:hypothetical protein